MGDSKVMILAV